VADRFGIEVLDQERAERITRRSDQQSIGMRPLADQLPGREVGLIPHLRRDLADPLGLLGADPYAGPSGPQQDSRNSAAGHSHVLRDIDQADTSGAFEFSGHKLVLHVGLKKGNQRPAMATARPSAG
jgi:hypothetical protein